MTILMTIAIILLATIIISRLAWVAQKFSFSVSKFSYINSQFKYQLLLFGLTCFVLSIAFFLNRENFLTFFSIGDIDTPAREVRGWALEQANPGCLLE